MYQFDKPFTFDRVMRILFTLLAVGGIVYLITLLRNALLPFLIAWLPAYLMQPVVKFFQYRLRLKSRLLAVVAVLFTSAGVLALLAVLIVPSIIKEMEKTVALVKQYRLGDGYIPFIPESWQQYLEAVTIDQWMELLNRENILNAVRQLAPRIWELLSNTFSILLGVAIVFVIFLYFIFILLDYEKMAGWHKLIPRRYRHFAEGLAEDVEQSMNRYFRGQSLVALCVGILFAVGFRIVGFPLGVTLGLFIGLLNLIPYLQVIGLVPITLLSLLHSAETGQSFWLIFGSALLVVVIVQIIQDLFLVPRIMGKAMNLNPAFILLSLSVWGTLLGFTGLIVALPLTTLCLSYYKRFILTEEDKQEEKAFADTEESE
ncbi:putative permease [Bacteroidales bacterium Barb6]|nr:putative permease [Bacteroidales bacterium Barb6]